MVTKSIAVNANMAVAGELHPGQHWQELHCGLWCQPTNPLPSSWSLLLWAKQVTQHSTTCHMLQKASCYGPNRFSQQDLMSKSKKQSLSPLIPFSFSSNPYQDFYFSCCDPNCPDANPNVLTGALVGGPGEAND